MIVVLDVDYIARPILAKGADFINSKREEELL